METENTFSVSGGKSGSCKEISNAQMISMDLQLKLLPATYWQWYKTQVNELHLQEGSSVWSFC